MPRRPRLDCPGAVHHVRARGIERRPIFGDDVDRAEFLERLAALSVQLSCPVYAWALIPDHFHLVLRSSALGISSFGRRLLGGYAGAFNRRHRRVGYLFQGRFKSTLVDDDRYLLELVRHVHLNPLRAGLIDTLEDLDQYPWSGHAALLGTRPNDWQETGVVLQRFDTGVLAARQLYREFVAAAVASHRPLALPAESLYPSQPFGRTSYRRPRGREEWTLDERLLGGKEFVARVLADAHGPAPTATAQGRRADGLHDTIAERCAAAQVAVAEVVGASKRPHLVSVRREICARAVLELGLPVGQVATALRISARTVLRALDHQRLRAPGRR